MKNWQYRHECISFWLWESSFQIGFCIDYKQECADDSEQNLAIFKTNKPEFLRRYVKMIHFNYTKSKWYFFYFLDDHCYSWKLSSWIKLILRNSPTEDFSSLFLIFGVEERFFELMEINEILILKEKKWKFQNILVKNAKVYLNVCLHFEK